MSSHSSIALRQNGDAYQGLLVHRGEGVEYAAPGLFRVARKSITCSAEYLPTRARCKTGEEFWAWSKRSSSGSISLRGIGLVGCTAEHLLMQAIPVKRRGLGTEMRGSACRMASSSRSSCGLKLTCTSSCCREMERTCHKLQSCRKARLMPIRLLDVGNLDHTTGI